MKKVKTFLTKCQVFKNLYENFYHMLNILIIKDTLKREKVERTKYIKTQSTCLFLHDNGKVFMGLYLYVCMDLFPL